MHKSSWNAQMLDLWSILSQPGIVSREKLKPITNQTWRWSILHVSASTILRDQQRQIFNSTLCDLLAYLMLSGLPKLFLAFSVPQLHPCHDKTVRTANAENPIFPFQQRNQFTTLMVCKTHQINAHCQRPCYIQQHLANIAYNDTVGHINTCNS